MAVPKRTGLSHRRRKAPIGRLGRKPKAEDKAERGEERREGLGFGGLGFRV